MNMHGFRSHEEAMRAYADVDRSPLGQISNETMSQWADRVTRGFQYVLDRIADGSAERRAGLIYFQADQDPTP